MRMMLRLYEESVAKFNARGHTWKGAWDNSNCTRCYLPNTDANRALQCRGAPEPIVVDLYFMNGADVNT
jgi:hypothetical protein